LLLKPEGAIAVTVEVEQGNWTRHAIQAYPEDLAIIGCGPCTGIVIACAELSVAYGAHFTAPDTHEGLDLSDMLKEAAAEFSGCASVVATLSGCCCCDDNTSWRNVRGFVEQAVRVALPHADLRAEWPAQGVTSVDMTVVMEDGCRCDVEFHK
jgi:hypothetical protein